MSNIKELMSKTKSFIEWIFGAVVLVIAIFYGISNFSTSYEKDRIALAKDIFRKTLRIGLEFEGEKVTENMLDVIMTTVQNKNKAECENSTTDEFDACYFCVMDKNGKIWRYDFSRSCNWKNSLKLHFL